MANDFSSLRNRRGNSLATLLDEVDKMQSGGAKEDERFWQPEVDKLGNGSAVIRFLPEAKDNSTPFVRIFKHGFKNEANGKWFIENCPTTLNQECPVCANNSEHWESGVESRKKIASARKRKLQYVANVLIVKDPKHPENEGQVKLFTFGKKIFDKITEAGKPRFEDQTPFDPFCPWEGANFNLRIVKEDGYRNYDRSTFSDPAPLGDDKRIEEVWKLQHDLREIIDPAKFKSSDQLMARFNQVVNGAAVASAADQIGDAADYTPPARNRGTGGAPKRPEPKQEENFDNDATLDIPSGTASSSGDDEDDYFANLLND